MVPHAILLDLDETLIDRKPSIAQYAERFHHDFADDLAPLPVPTLAATILTADEQGYRPREALYADLLQQLAWRQRPEIGRLRTHWETWFPALSVARVGLHETLATLHAQGIRLGVITNGTVGRQYRPPIHPGEMLQEEFLQPMGLTQRELVAAIHVPYQGVNEIINGKRGVTPSTALRLGKFFGMTAAFWLNLQLRWDLYYAQQAEQAELERIHQCQPQQAAVGVAA